MKTKKTKKFNILLNEDWMNDFTYFNEEWNPSPEELEELKKLKKE